MTNGDNHGGTIAGAGELDLWTFTANQGDALSVSIGEVGDVALFVPWIRLRAPDGTNIGSATNYQSAQIDMTAPQTGAYTVIVASGDTAHVGTGQYVLTLARTPGAFVVPADDEGGPLTNGANHQGVIRRADLDQWTFTANQGDALSVSIGEVGDVDLFVPWIRLRAPNGANLGSANNYQAAQIDATAPQSGTYTVVVSSADTARAGAGTYLLTIANTPGAFAVPTGDEGGPMTNGGNHAGAIHRGDLDQWTFTATQGDALSISIGEVGDVDLFVPWIRLRAPNGANLGSANNYQAAQINATAPQTGTYTVVVSSADTARAGAGAYRLTMANTPGTFVVPAGDEGGVMTNGATHQGAIHRGDLDPWTFTAIQGAALTVSIGEVGDNPAFVPWIRLRAPNGANLGSANNYQGAQINATATQTGTYTVVVASADVAHVGTGTYNLQVAGAVPTPPDTDADGLPDAWETRFGLDPTSSAGDNGASSDPDGDGLTNAQELAGDTHPRGFFIPSLAEGARNAFFDVSVAFLNVGAAPARVWLRFLEPGGATATLFHLLPPNQRWTLGRSDFAFLTASDFSTVAESDQPIVVDRTMSWGGGYGSHAETAVARPATTWHLAEGSTSGEFSLFYLLQNANPVPVDVTVRYLLPLGQAPIEQRLTLAANSRTTIAVDDQGPALASTDVSAVITAAAPIIVERAMYRSTPGQPFAAGHGSAGVTAPSLTWFLAEGATGPFFDMFILLANPNAQAAAVTVEYLLVDGTVHTKAYVVPAEARFTIWVDNEEIPAGSGRKPLENVAVSATVTSTNGVPIIVERTMWWPGPETSPNFWTEAHNSPGTTQTGTRWALAEGEVGGSQSAETYILIANTSAFAGQARVTLYFEDGTSAARTIDLRPRSRTNVAVSGVFAEAAGRRFASVVDSLGATPAQIVVERAMYTSPGGETWAAGTNALATRLR